MPTDSPARDLLTSVPACLPGCLGSRPRDSCLGGKQAVFLSPVSRLGFTWNPYMGVVSADSEPSYNRAEELVSGHCCLFKWFYDFCGVFVFVS